MQDKPDKDTPPSGAEEEALTKRVESFMGVPPDQFPKEVLEGKTKSHKPEQKKPATSEAMTGAVPVVVAPEKPEVPEEKPETESEPEETPDDTETEKAVKDIVEKESDEVLAAEDAVAKAFEPKKTGFKEKVKNFLKKWWDNPKARWATIISVVLLLIALTTYPTTRYFMLNTAGVRSSASLTVLDDSTQLPLKNVTVTLAGQNGTTDGDGKVRLTRLKLGKTELIIRKPAFAEEKKKVTVGWGSNPLGEFALRAVGTQYSFVVTDFLSGKPIEEAEASSGIASALSDGEGKILLTVEETEAETLQITIRAETYRDETFDLALGATGAREVKLVPARKHVFVTKRSGKYDVYKIDVDGNNEELVLKGTGTERNDITLAAHPYDEVAAMVSTRDNTRNSDGYLLSTLTLLDLKGNTAMSVTQSERVQIIGWIDSRLIFVKVAAGASANNPKRHRLISYDYKTGSEKELAYSNGFNDVLVAGSNVYYAPSSYLNTSGANFYKSNADGSNRQTILEAEVWTILRLQYEQLSLSVGQDWYDYKFGEPKAAKAASAPVSFSSRIYADSPDRKHSLWVDERDGKGVLLNYDVEAKAEAVLKTQSGLSNPLRWLNNTSLVYRIQTQQETADYVINIDGGEARKIKDVTNTTGIDQWYYY